jgi:hypothetical protein
MISYEVAKYLLTVAQNSFSVATQNAKCQQRGQMTTNTSLWDAVCKTDPTHTKSFKKGGGFSGTAIKPYWLMRRATETFGPCGIGWGWEEIENKMVAGVWCSKVRLWYAQNNQRGQIEQWGQTVMEDQREIKIDGKGTGSYKPYVDEEAPKKAVTDAVTKCLSYLGFAGDVHMGLFDDSKYVNELRHEFAEHKAEFETTELRQQFVDNCLQAIAAADTGQKLRDLNDLNMAKWNAIGVSKDKSDADAWSAISSAFKAKAAILKAAQPKAEGRKPATVDSAVRGGESASVLLGGDTIAY